MRLATWAVLLGGILMAACGPEPNLTAVRAKAIDEGVRTFAKDVAREVTAEGPAGWTRQFSSAPEFFMASEGRMVFSSGKAAAAGIRDLTQRIKQIKLEWGDDLRVDPLVPNLAAMAASYHESMVLAAGDTIDQKGFFTGTAEFNGGRWRFRNAHWSVERDAPAIR